MSICLHEYLCTMCIPGVETKELDLQGQVQVVVSCQIWVLGTELGSSKEQRH